MDIYLFGGHDTRYSTNPVVPANACWNRINTLKCYDHEIKKEGNKWMFEQEPTGDGQWMQSIDYTTQNCIVEEIKLEKACDDCLITSKLGDLKNNTPIGYATHNTSQWYCEITHYSITINAK